MNATIVRIGISAFAVAVSAALLAAEKTRGARPKGGLHFCCDSAAFYEDICREASNAAAFGMVVHETHGAVKTKQEDLFLHYARDIPAGNRIDFERAI